ncbi:hypothetical protein Fmac_023026 [Flemingia macrophylla]|uniref:Uncharacterized protein n=1 Tax=Flemingia macrophylla TaxID=520843 RepID=A0ABD1LKB2_9FABA
MVKKDLSGSQQQSPVAALLATPTSSKMSSFPMTASSASPAPGTLSPPLRPGYRHLHLPLCHPYQGRAFRGVLHRQLSDCLDLP